MEVQWDVERYCVDDYGSDEVSEDQASAWVTDDEPERHDGQVDNGFRVDEEREANDEGNQAANDKWMGPGKDVATQILLGFSQPT